MYNDTIRKPPTACILLDQNSFNNGFQAMDTLSFKKYA